MTATALSNPVFAAQATFRTVLDAMARPGTIHKIEAQRVRRRCLPPRGHRADALRSRHAVWLDENLRASRR